MSSATYTPSATVDMNKERDWPANLGMLDWDNTKIVFTKRTLLEFLKYAGVTVDPNFTNIQKLPRYAKFGTLSAEVSAPPAESSAAGQEAPSSKSSGAVEGFIPTRKVREPPGGATHNIFRTDEDDDALATAPPPSTNGPQTKARTKSGVASLWDAPPEEEWKPTRKVREMPGGKDSISGIW